MKKEMTIMDRLQTPSPSLFQKIQKWGVVIAAVAAGLTIFRDNLADNGIFLPGIVAKAIEIFGYISAAVAGVSTLPYDEARLKEKTVLGAAIDWLKQNSLN